MKVWMSADKAIQKHEDYVDAKYFNDPNGYPKKLEELIKKREELLAKEIEDYQKMMKERAERKARQAEQGERLC